MQIFGTLSRTTTNFWKPKFITLIYCSGSRYVWVRARGLNRILLVGCLSEHIKPPLACGLCVYSWDTCSLFPKQRQQHSHLVITTTWCLQHRYLSSPVQQLIGSCGISLFFLTDFLTFQTHVHDSTSSCISHLHLKIQNTVVWWRERMSDTEVSTFQPSPVVTSSGERN